MINVDQIVRDANALMPVSVPPQYRWAEDPAYRPVLTALLTAVADAVDAEVSQLRRELAELKAYVGVGQQ